MNLYRKTITFMNSKMLSMEEQMMNYIFTLEKAYHMK